MVWWLPLVMWTAAVIGDGVDKTSDTRKKLGQYKKSGCTIRSVGTLLLFELSPFSSPSFTPHGSKALQHCTPMEAKGPGLLDVVPIDGLQEQGQQ